jgi:hypothetical protein
MVNLRPVYLVAALEGQGEIVARPDIVRVLEPALISEQPATRMLRADIRFVSEKNEQFVSELHDLT